MVGLILGTIMLLVGAVDLVKVSRMDRDMTLGETNRLRFTLLLGSVLTVLGTLTLVYQGGKAL